MTYSPTRPGSVRVDTPALDELGRAPSCYEGIARLMEQGRLGELRKDIAAIEDAAREGRLERLVRKGIAGGASLAKAAARGQAAGYIRAEEAWRASPAGRAMAAAAAKAADLERKAAEAADPRDREAYEELAAKARKAALA